jgi:hypothetical protein
MLVRRFYLDAIITPLNVEAKMSIRGLAPSGLGWYNPKVRVAARQPVLAESQGGVA